MALSYSGAGVKGKTPNVYMPYSYDAVLVYANALKGASTARHHRHSPLEPRRRRTALIDNKLPINQTNLWDALKTVNITGLTGPITFDGNQVRENNRHIKKGWLTGEVK